MCRGQSVCDGYIDERYQHDDNPVVWHCQLGVDEDEICDEQDGKSHACQHLLIDGQRVGIKREPEHRNQCHRERQSADDASKISMLLSTSKAVHEDRKSVV